MAYVFLLFRAPAEGAWWLRDSFLGNLVFGLAAAILFRRAYANTTERSWAIPLGLAICSYMAGANTYLLIHAINGEVSPPSWADLGYLAVYPFMLAGILLALREHLRGVRLIVALDGITGSLAGAAVATAAIAPLISRVWNGSPTALVSIAYPLGDVVLVAASLGALGIVGVHNGRHFALWAFGMLVFGVGDIVYAYRLAFDQYQVGTWLDALWAIGLAMVAMGAVTRKESRPRGVPGARSLVVVTVGSVLAVIVLAIAPSWGSNPVPSILALLTLVGGGVRFALAFLQLRELAIVREQAMTDELTGAANRRALYNQLDDLFRPVVVDIRGEQETLPPPSFTLALIDLDHFKEVNDSFGHAAGDELLQTVVTRFGQALDELQTPHLLARLGGDEFAVILHAAATRKAAMIVGAALLESLAEPVVLADAVLHAQASIGLAIAPMHGENRGDILFAADAAMYSSKTSGQRLSFHSPAGVGDRRKRLAVAEDLYTALERRELTVAYQPILTAAGRLVAAEALVRWDHPERGRLSPGEFLEAAERYRLTQVIAERVLDVTLADLARWRADGGELTASVNVSASDLRDESIVGIVASALLKHRLPPEVMTIEITETAMMHDPGKAQSVMQALHELGVQLAVDDYGTGYSSLEYLLKLPISEIKLDRAFSANLGTEVRAKEIVRSTVDLTHALGLRMVAEGVENEQSLTVLCELGCDLVQGWHLGRPMSANAFESLSMQHSMTIDVTMSEDELSTS